VTTWNETQQTIKKHLDDADMHICLAAQYGEKWVETLEESDGWWLPSMLLEIMLVLSRNRLALKDLNALINTFGPDDPTLR